VEAFLASRDACASLTRDNLEEGVTADALVATAAASAQFADEALAIVDEEYRPAIACREGCSYCCRKPGVLVTLPEVFRIIAHVRETQDARGLDELKARTDGYVTQLRGRHFNDPTADSVQCPLLVDDRCSVYDVRPLVCRGFNSTSAEACADAHGGTERLIPIFSILKDVTDGATVGVAQQLKQAGLGQTVLDLGTALSIALERPDAVESVVRGGHPFEPAEDASWVNDLWSSLRKVAGEVGIRT
jgi:Fe-S-cluster containining protein